MLLNPVTVAVAGAVHIATETVTDDEDDGAETVMEAVTDDNVGCVEEGGDDIIHEHDNDEKEDLVDVVADGSCSHKTEASLITTMYVLKR